MVETRGDELGLQILRAVQELGTRMERVEVQVNQLGTRMERLEVQVNQLSTRMERLETRMDKQEKWMERLGAEFLHFREEVRGDIRQWRVELQEDHRRLKKRLEATVTTVVLMASVLRGPTEFSVELEAHLSELHAG